MGVSPTSWVMSSATRSRVPSIVFILTVQSTGGEMEASTAGAGAGVGQQAQGFRFSCNLFVSHSVACQQPAMCREHRRCRGKHVLQCCRMTILVCQRQLLASAGGSRSPVQRALTPLLHCCFPVYFWARSWPG